MKKIINGSRYNTETAQRLGVHENNPNSFVTWKCKGQDDYYWGHYFTNLLAAQKDFCKRALEEIKDIEVMNKPPKTNER